MGDLQVGETFRDRWYVIETATGNPWLLQTIPVVVIDESGNRSAPANATEESDGWYYLDVTPDAAGTWSTEAALAGATFVNNYIHYFKVGGGEVTDIKTETALIKTDTTAILIDTAALDGRVTDARAVYLDELAAANVPADVDTANAALVVIDEFHDVPAQNSANNAQINEVLGNKTDTTAGNSVVALLKQILEDTGTTLDDLVDGIETRTNNLEVTKTFFSPSQISVTVPAGAADLALPTVTLPNITGTITHVYAGIKFRMIENTNAGANKLSGAQSIQVRVDTPGAWANCISFVDDQFGLAATTREGGDCVIGATDVVGTVTAFNDGYEFQWDEAVADLASIVLNDVQTFLIVSYY